MFVTWGPVSLFLVFANIFVVKLKLKYIIMGILNLDHREVVIVVTVVGIMECLKL